MSAYYDLYETPDVQNTGEKQPLHARIVPSGTYSQKEFIERVSRYQHFPQNMVDGVLGAVIENLVVSWRVAILWSLESWDILVSL